MHLADPPFISHFLLENPWPVSLAAGAVALVLFWVARQSENRRTLAAAALLLLIAAGVQLAARVVVTPREQILAATQELLDDTAPLNLDAFKARLDPRFNVTLPDDSVWLDGQTVLSKLEQASRKFTIDRQVIVNIEAEMRTDSAGLTLFDVRTETKGGSVPTRWMITWVKHADGSWKALKLQWLDCPLIGGLKADPGML